MCFMELEKVKCCLPALTRCPFCSFVGLDHFFSFLFFSFSLQLLFALHSTSFAGDANILLFILLPIEEEDQLQSLHKS